MSEEAPSPAEESAPALAAPVSVPAAKAAEVEVATPVEEKERGEEELAADVAGNDGAAVADATASTAAETAEAAVPAVGEAAPPAEPEEETKQPAFVEGMAATESGGATVSMAATKSAVEGAVPPVPPAEEGAAVAANVETTVTTIEHIKVMIVTWNVGNTRPTAAGVAACLPPGEFEAMDVIVVGNQECKYKGDGSAEKSESSRDGAAASAAAGASVDGAEERRTSMPSVASKRLLQHHYTHLLQAHVGGDFALVGSESLMEMRIAVFAKTMGDAQLEKTLRATVKTSRSATGLLGVVGNKGGLVVTLTVRGTSIVFVSCHLAAHLKEYKARNSDCREILREALVGNKQLDVISQFDHCFWLGDLNYRVDVDGSKAGAECGGKEATPIEERHAFVSGLVAEEKWSELMEMDQLRRAQRDGEALVGFEEGEPTFKPTFKVVKDIEVTEHQSKRVPSYCDRILWRSMPHLLGKVRLLSLNSCPSVSTSDHKPVRAILEIDPSPEVVRVAEEEVERHCPVVSITELRAQGLFNADGAGDLSDPYVIFYTDPAGILNPPGTAAKDGTKAGAKYPPRTAVKMDDLNPRWENSEIPTLRPRVKSAVELGSISLIMAVYDRDRTNADDLLGIAMIRFPSHSKLTKTLGGAAFSEQLLLNGKVFGSIEGRIAVDWSGEAETHEAISVNSGCCTIG